MNHKIRYPNHCNNLKDWFCSNSCCYKSLAEHANIDQSRGEQLHSLVERRSKHQMPPTAASAKCRFLNIYVYIILHFLYHCNSNYIKPSLSSNQQSFNIVIFYVQSDVKFSIDSLEKWNQKRIYIWSLWIGHLLSALIYKISWVIVITNLSDWEGLVSTIHLSSIKILLFMTWYYSFDNRRQVGL